ncbi:MAG: hypothetical protein AAFP02_03730, partial [Bacteroidota bacterium]
NQRFISPIYRNAAFSILAFREAAPKKNLSQNQYDKLAFLRDSPDICCPLTDRYLSWFRALP